MNDTAKLLASAVLGGLLGGGVLYRLVLGALENRLRTTFATRRELNAVGDRVNALETVVVQARDQADHANERVTLMEERAHQQWKQITERLSEVVVRPLERLTERLEKIGEEQVRQQEQIKTLFRKAAP